MSRYRKIDPRIWNDEKFHDLHDESKLVFLFILTHPHMTPLGAMRTTIPGLAGEIGWDEKAFAEAFAEAFAKGFFDWNEKRSYLGLKNFFKYNPPESPNVLKSWAKFIDYLPECELRNAQIIRLKDFAEGWGEAFAEAYRKAFGKPTPKASLNHEHEHEHDIKEYPPLCPPTDAGGKTEDSKTEKSSKPKKPKKPDWTIDWIRETWNEQANPRLPRITHWTKKRRDAAKLRANDYPDKDQWIQAIKAMNHSPLCLGENKRQWKANIDFFLRPDSIAKLIEGNYRGEYKPQSNLPNKGERRQNPPEAMCDCGWEGRIMDLSPPLPTDDQSDFSAYKRCPQCGKLAKSAADLRYIENGDSSPVAARSQPEPILDTPQDEKPPSQASNDVITPNTEDEELPF